MKYYVGWDVGAWNCRKASESQDALAILAADGDSLVLKGNLFRGPLRSEIADIKSIEHLLNSHCNLSATCEDEFVIGIDTPLGLPEAVQWHVTLDRLPSTIEKRASHNPYLYRRTEQLLADKNYPPLSAIKDMIGSQFTKGLHFLRKLQLERLTNPVGVWKKDKITAIEVYPATCKASDTNGYSCKGSQVAQSLFSSIRGKGEHLRTDETDALYCAIVAYLFAEKRHKLAPPPKDIPVSEGWIWHPVDSVGRTSKKKSKS